MLPNASKSMRWIWTFRESSWSEHLSSWGQPANERPTESHIFLYFFFLSSIRTQFHHVNVTDIYAPTHTHTRTLYHMAPISTHCNCTQNQIPPTTHPHPIHGCECPAKQQVELSFKTGEVILVYGSMDEDGFYMGELDGVRGLVPSNFLTEAVSDLNHNTCYINTSLHTLTHKRTNVYQLDLVSIGVA